MIATGACTGLSACAAASSSPVRPRLPLCTRGVSGLSTRRMAPAASSAKSRQSRYAPAWTSRGRPAPYTTSTVRATPAEATKKITECQAGRRVPRSRYPISPAHTAASSSAAAGTGAHGCTPPCSVA
ncbi:hypothetical protein RB614_25385 [Phytohabitans sp. ZYX-F-186]|uniref:Uncharacterized protein n=1 Tax=Phytohabitans maris TaxID=3071409 RepID=A0ABU0ZLD3_9ACTN|nr:hypothetical protein [Phytohabitans sp. ZYX-F-186]MDQ7907861.1 hypothetical protein [Phytohabitans sp. ZYX-F-186]